MVDAPMVVKNLPAKAINVQSLLDIILQVLSIIDAIGRIFGIDFDLSGGN